MKTPILDGYAQSDFDMAGHSLLNYPGGGGSGATVNVKSPPYNATGLGVADDTAAIQAAINFVASLGGGTVFFPRGIYLCNGAFDATTNSVLKFPYVPLTVGAARGRARDAFAGYRRFPSVRSGSAWNNPVTIELLGEMPATVSAVPFITTQGSIIKCTKTGTGTAPAILAPYSYIGRQVAADYTAQFSYVQPVLRNLLFQTGVNPSIFAVRLDSAVMAIVEDVVIETADGGGAVPVEPTHGTVGLFMPTYFNFGNYVNRVWVAGFDTGYVAADHFRAPRAEVLNCHVGFEFLSTPQFGWGNLGVVHCNTAIKFTDIDSLHRYAMDLTVEIEQIDTGWQLPTATSDILDPNNVGNGEIRYWILQLNAGHKTIGVTGGNNLRLIDTANVFGAVTVATLPTGALGRTAVVTDGAASLAWGATVTGGGSAKYFVGYNGTNWTVIGK